MYDTDIHRRYGLLGSGLFQIFSTDKFTGHTVLVISVFLFFT